MLYYVQYVFYGLPVLALIFFIVSLCRFIYAKKKNKIQPGWFGVAEMRKRKRLLVISSVIAGVFAAVIVGLAILLYTAVAFM